MSKILIVEDEQYLRDLYAQILTEAGYSVDSAKDGEEGWQKASQGGYDLILLDIMMPKMDGLSILKKLKETPPAAPNKKIIMLSVLRENRYIDDSMANGASGYLVKSSVTPEQLVAEVKKILES